MNAVHGFRFRFKINAEVANVCVRKNVLRTKPYAAVNEASQRMHEKKSTQCAENAAKSSFLTNAATGGKKNRSVKKTAFGAVVV